MVARFLPYWESAVVPDLRAGKIVLLAAHGNSLRALVKHLDGISDADIAELNIPTGIPLRYELDDALQPDRARRDVPGPGGRGDGRRRGGRPGALSPSRGSTRSSIG